jgi:hypothetical protein
MEGDGCCQTEVLSQPLSGGTRNTTRNFIYFVSRLRFEPNTSPIQILSSTALLAYSILYEFYHKGAGMAQSIY